MTGPTSRQRQVLQIYARREQEGLCPPAIREMGLELGIRSNNAVNDLLRALERKGLLKTLGPSMARGRVLTPAGRTALGKRMVTIQVLRCDHRAFAVAISGVRIAGPHQCTGPWLTVFTSGQIDSRLVLGALAGRPTPTPTKSAAVGGGHVSAAKEKRR